MNEHPTVIAASLDSSQVQDLEQLSDEEFWDYARTLAGRAPPNLSSEDYLECKLHRECCLIPLAALDEVVPPPHRCTQLPAAPEWMPGVVAWRGETIAVIDLDAYLFGDVQDTVDHLSKGLLLITNHKSLQLGICVPAIWRTRLIQLEQMIPSTKSIAAPAGVVRGMYADALVINLPVFLADVVQQIGITAFYG